MPVSAIIPAYNEERTISQLVEVFKNSGLFFEIIVVNDGSKDKTGLLAQKAEATVINLPKNLGKGEALTLGVRASTGPIILFFDADLSGINRTHLLSLIELVEKNEAEMVIGVQSKWKEMYDWNEAIPVLSGQRAMKREIFEQVPDLLRKGYQIEEALNYYCKMNGQKVKIVVLEGLEHLQKIPKSNLVKGVFGYIKMSWQIAKIYVIVRIIRFFKFTLELK